MMPAKFSVLAVSATPLLSVALACGGDGDGGKGIMVMPDSSMTPTPDSPAMANCMVEPMLTPSFGMDDQFAETNGSGHMGSNAHTEVWGARLNQDPTPDVIQVELYAGFAAFANSDIMPKTIELAGEELNYKTCGACVRIFADATQNATGAQYFATGGTLTLTSTTGNLTGTLSNVTLTKVTIAEDFTSTPVGDGCNTTVVSANMDAPLQQGSGGMLTGGNMPTGKIVLRGRTL